MSKTKMYPKSLDSSMSFDTFKAFLNPQPVTADHNYLSTLAYLGGLPWL